MKNLIYFSATGTTAKIVKAVGGDDNQAKCFDITGNIDHTVDIPSDTLAIFGVPVYSGRVPKIAADNLKKFTGNGTPAIIVCAYGNRAIDDALLELKDIVQGNNFRVIAAGAFIAEHSIFPSVAHARPDTDDLQKAHQFGITSMELLSQAGNIDGICPVEVKGNRPYRDVTSIPLYPQTDKQCNNCGICASQCPVGAIDAQNPRKIDKTKCIHCAHCISTCNRKAKHFGGLLYALASRKFGKKCNARQEPYLVYGELF